MNAAPGGFDLPEERSGHAPPPGLAMLRRQMADAVAAGTWAIAPPAREEWLGGVRVLRVEPPARACATILHFHGGAYRNGAPEMIGPYAAALAKACATEVVLPAYRLAPEHPFPSGLRDGLAVARALGQAAPLVLSGDSAGGGLAAALTKLCIAAGLAVRALVLHSPWLDLTLASETYRTNAATDPLFSLASATAAAALYLQGVPAEHPLASPLLGDLSGFPPSFISVGTGEVLANDSLHLHASLGKAGIRSELLAVAGMEHVAVTRGLNNEGAMAVFGETVKFLADVLK